LAYAQPPQIRLQQHEFIIDFVISSEWGKQQIGMSKEEYAGALRGHQSAVDATKSAQREEAYAWDTKKCSG
jgi:hypothetical protein